MREVTGSSQRSPNQRETSSMPSRVTWRTLLARILKSRLGGRGTIHGMPYEIELERDAERGLDRYRVSVGEGFDAADAHELSDWVSAAAQNPTAVFTIDVTRASRGS